jgi:hypothetical protein
VFSGQGVGSLLIHSLLAMRCLSHRPLEAYLLRHLAQPGVERETRGGAALERFRVGEQRLLEGQRGWPSRFSGRAPLQPQHLQPPGHAEVVQREQPLLRPVSLVRGVEQPRRVTDLSSPVFGSTLTS